MSASGDDTPSSAIRRLRNLTEGDVNIVNVLTAGIGAIIAAWLTGAADLGIEVWQTVTNPLDALGDGIGNIVSSTLGGSASIITTGAGNTESALSESLFAFPIALIIVLGVAWIVAKWAQREATSDTFLPFSATDIPIIGTTENADDD